MTESLAAVVVTYNRKALLVECLTALLNQTHCPDRIYVIDQNSTDGTEDLLRECGILSNRRVSYWKSSENTGGAGGFRSGIAKAYQAGYSWIWVMDDDAIPDPDACQEMLPLTQENNVAAIANHVLTAQRKTDSRHKVISRNTQGKYPALKFSSFVGLLVRREAVKAIGLPKAEFFFQFDDNEYCARLMTYGQILFAESSYITHKEPAPSRVRKQFLFWSFSRIPAERCWITYFALRNNLWRLLHHPQSCDYASVMRYVAVVLSDIPMVLLLDRDNIVRRLHLLFRGVSDGIMGNFDNEFGFRMRREIAMKTAPRSTMQTNIAR